MYPGHNFKADVTDTDTAGEITVKQLNDVHNTSWNAIGPPDPPQTIPVYAVKSFAKVNNVEVKAALPF